MLTKGARVRVEPSEGSFRKLLSIISGAAEPPLNANSDGSLPGYVAFSLLKAQNEPKAKDRVVVLDQGIPIKAGDLIGHLGVYQNHNDMAQPLMHLEVFSCEDVPSFIAKSRTWAHALPDSDKTLLKVHKNASRLIAHRIDINADNPPKISEGGSEIDVDLIIPQALLDDLPAANKIKVVNMGTPQDTRWWRLDGLFEDKGGNPINGWLAEQDLITTRHSPWEWPDFQCVEDTDSPAEKLAYAFHIKGILSSEEQHKYRTQINKTDGGPILTIARLYNIVDTDNDGALTSDEIRTAIGYPWRAQVLGQLIIKYESEWFWDQSKWDELDPLMEEVPGQPNPIWQTEKKRIEALSWWKELADKHGINTDGKAWHFHPTWLIAPWLSLRELISSSQMREIFPDSAEAKREEVRRLFNQYAERFGIDTPERISQFFAQIKAEVGYTLLGKEESLWYSVEALKTTFRRYFGVYPEEAEELGYKRVTLKEYNTLPPAVQRSYTVQGRYAYSQLPQPEEIAKRVYCCNTEAGSFALTKGGCEEGLMYKGKGFIQLTWKSNYEAVENILKEKLPEELVDIVANPDQLLETKIGLLSAMGFWWIRNLNDLSTDSTESTDSITAVVNLHTNSYEKRRNYFTAIYQVFQS